MAFIYLPHHLTVHCLQDESDFVKKTNSGFDALYSYHDHREEVCLGRAIQIFRYALELQYAPEQSGFGPICRAIALFISATSKFIGCQTHGTYSRLNKPIELYQEALESRDYDHPDRPATLPLLAQALDANWASPR